MAKSDFYKALEVERTVDQETIKKAYRNLAMKYHPDRNPGNSQAADRMKEINEAYAILSDPEKRRLYDVYGHAGLEGYTQEDIFRGVDFSSLFREFGLGDVFGFGGGLFDSMFGRPSTQGRVSRKGADLRYDLSLTLEDVFRGVDKTLDLTRDVICPSCRGTGAEDGGSAECDVCKGSGQEVREHVSGATVIRQITTCRNCRGAGNVVKNRCNVCEGSGLVTEREEVEVNVPAGASTGHALRIRGKGEEGPETPGDLYVVVHVQDHPLFERNGNDIYLAQDISATTAALGGDIHVPSLNGNVSVAIPEGTQTGAMFRIEGEGLPSLDGSGMGSEFVMVKVITPTRLTPEEKKLLREFQKLRDESESKSR